MLEIRMHGMAGQGVVTAGSILAQAVVRSGSYALKMPVYSGARRGEQVVVFIRMDDEPVLDRSHVLCPDVVVVFDSKAAEDDYLHGMRRSGTLVLNTSAEPTSVARGLRGRCCTVDADSVSRRIYGDRPISLTNMVVLGALARAIGHPPMECLLKVVEETFAGGADENTVALQAGYDSCSIVTIEPGQARPDESLVSPARSADVGLMRLHEVPVAPVVGAGTRKPIRTGLWRSARPVVSGKCTGCGTCVPLCPEGVIGLLPRQASGRGLAAIDYNYCKGCGICASVCPVAAVSMDQEGGVQ